MKIAIEGCAHGELEKIYETVKFLEENENIKVDLLICCGDFQSVRNKEDLHCMNVPKKYARMCSFYKYYSGELQAPILTIFIGGNHEASNYLQELPYGGWVAPNIYYLGYAGVINIAGIRIAGLSGIFKAFDYHKGRFEVPPYNEDTIRSVYHIRSLEVYRLKHLSKPVDIFLSHDWPTNVTDYGNLKGLLRYKQFFKNDIETGKLGSPPCEELLWALKPKYYFAAHLHCKFSALIPHEADSDSEETEFTKFLALDKCIPGKRFLQILDIPHDSKNEIKIHYDLEWLTILFSTNNLLSIQRTQTYMPTFSDSEKSDYAAKGINQELIVKKFDDNLLLPLNFTQTAHVYNAERPTPKDDTAKRQVLLNPQTKEFCEKLGIDDPIELILMSNDSYSTCDQLKSFADNDSFKDNSYETVTTSIQDISVPRSVEVKRKFKLSLPEPKFNHDDTGTDNVP